MKTALATFVLAVLPVLATAECYDGHATTMSCAEGTVWDAETQACVPQTTS